MVASATPEPSASSASAAITPTAHILLPRWACVRDIGAAPVVLEDVRSWRPSYLAEPRPLALRPRLATGLPACRACIGPSNGSRDTPGRMLKGGKGNIPMVVRVEAWIPDGSPSAPRL